MKKYFLICFALANIFCSNTMNSCPCGFSPEDQRPFFEQYDENKPTHQKPKEIE